MTKVIPITEFPKTPGEAKRWVVDRILAISAERRVGTDVARSLLAAEMLNDARKWWELLGEHCISEVFRDAIRAGSSYTNGDRVPPDPSTMRKGEDWRSAEHSVWDRIVPVGSTGAKRRYGDLTNADLLVISTFYERQANTMKRKAKLYREAAGFLKGEETLESAESKLPKHLIAFFHDQTGQPEQAEARETVAA